LGGGGGVSGKREEEKTIVAPKNGARGFCRWGKEVQDQQKPEDRRKTAYLQRKAKRVPEKYAEASKSRRLETKSGKKKKGGERKNTEGGWETTKQKKTNKHS